MLLNTFSQLQHLICPECYLENDVSNTHTIMKHLEHMALLKKNKKTGNRRFMVCGAVNPAA